MDVIQSYTLNVYLYLISVQLSDLVRVSAESPPVNVASISYPLSPTLRKH